MPLYEYICLECSQKFEELVSSETKAVKCPHCGSEKTTKQFSTFASNALKGNDACSTCTPKSGHT